MFAIDFPAGRGAIISQFRVWPFPSTLIMTFGERNRNPGHHFAGILHINTFYLNYDQKKLTQKGLIVRISIVTRGKINGRRFC
jgi:hypothetical protein